jgi:hypothetical protein
MSGASILNFRRSELPIPDLKRARALATGKRKPEPALGMVRNLLSNVQERDAMKLSEVIRDCANVERLIREVYERFAEKFPDGPIGELWRELAVEESIHETRLRNIASLPLTNRDDPSFTPERLEALRQTVLGHLSSEPTTLDGAFATAMALENLELENIYRRLFALTTSDARMSSALRAAMGEVGKHEQRIVSAIQHHSMDRALLERAGRAHQAWLTHGAA